MKVNGEQKNGVNGADNFIFQGADSSYGDGFNTPVDVILPVYDAWTHYAYEFTPDGFYIYQNGKLVVSKDGNFTASQFYGENGKFVLGATDMWNDADWTGSISDFRIYDSALSGGDIINEFDITYADLLTASYDFENGGGDAVYVPDYVYSNSGWRVLRVGGCRDYESRAGLWCFEAVSAPSSSYASVGARLLYNP